MQEGFELISAEEHVAEARHLGPARVYRRSAG